MAQKTNKTQQSLDVLTQLKDSAIAYKEWTTGGLVAILLIISGIVYYSNLQDENEQEAHAQLFPAVFFFEKDSLNKALEGDGNSTDGLLSIAEDYSSTQAGNLSHFYIGVSYLKRGEYDKSIEHLKQFSTDDYLIQARKLALTGDAYLEKGDTEQAISFYEKASEYYPNKEFTPTYMIKLANAYEQKGDKAKAIKVYATILKDYDDIESALLYDVKRWKASLQ